MRTIFKALELRLRALAPDRMRLLVRAARATTVFKPSRELPDELVRDCRFCSSRAAMLDRLPHGGVVAELGTERGDFAREIASRCAPRELHLVDLDFSRFDERGLTGVRRHRGLTDHIISTFPDEYFDWIYIDADHSYAGVMKDVAASAPKIRPGGFLVFNDFAHIDPMLGRYGVHRAVVDFALEAKWPLRLFAFSASALYDVALQKP